MHISNKMAAEKRLREHSWKPLLPTPLLDVYWKFAVERQKIYFARLSGDEPPWTLDPILQEYKFTNAYRAADRVSQYLIRNVTYSGPSDFEEVFLRTLLFKLFNKIETWELLTKAVGEVSTSTFAFPLFDQVLTGAIEGGERIYSAAYIMPTGGRGTQFSRKHRLHLSMIENMIATELPARILECKTMQQGFDLLRKTPTIGDFLAYQYITDLNYGDSLTFSEMEFVVAGPGAQDGISKCFIHTAGLSDSEVIRMVADRQDAEFQRLGLDFRDLWGRPLQLIDCQNLFCEVSKYTRVSHPEIPGISGRTRIKQKFVANKLEIKPCFPPKWKLASES